MREGEREHYEKDFWDKIDILMKPLGGLFTGLALAAVGWFTTDLLKKQEATQTNQRLYTEIMSSREKADSELRKEMFNSIIKAFLDPDNASLDEKVLANELLAYNFHDVIDLSPLFKHVAKAISKSEVDNKKELNSQLERVAGEVIDKQLASLSGGGRIQKYSWSFTDIKNNSQEFDEVLFPMRLDKPENGEERYVYVEALQAYPETSEIKVRLESSVNTKEGRMEPEIDVIFKVGFFDFPMIDNTRVSHSQRIGIALTRWTDYGAELALVYFPASRASLKEKLYYDEVINELHKSTAAMIERRDNQ